MSAASPQKLLNPDVPMHHQIYQRLKMDIIDGMWAGQNDFPGEEEVAHRFRVSAITSRKALERLALEGFLRRDRGRRSIILYQPPPPPTGLVPNMLPLRRSSYDYTVLAAGVRVVPQEACAAFDLPAGSPLWSCTRMRQFEGRPHSVSQSVQRPALGEQHSTEALATMPMAEIIRQAGQKIVRLRKRIVVTLPNADVAGQLGVGLQTPLLLYCYVLYDEDNQVVQWVRIHLHPDEFVPWETVNIVERLWEEPGLI